MKWNFNIFRKRIIAECGHSAYITDTVHAFGEQTTTTVPVIDGKIEYCHRCLEKMAIRCAWCGKAIFIGDPITLYSPVDKNRMIPDYAVLYNKEHLSYVGCLRWDCADTGADMMGFWFPPGAVKRVLSPLERLLNDPEKKCVITQIP